MTPRHADLLRLLPARLRTHDVETGRSDAYPDLQPLALLLPPDRVYRAALETAAAMPRWRILARRPEDRTLDAVARTRLLRFADDVRVTVEPAGARGSRVRVRSASRIGLTDFGTNARRIRSYLRRLAALLGAGGVEPDDA